MAALRHPMKNIAIILTIFLAGCASSNKPKGDGIYGYEDRTLGDGVHHVKYTFVNWRGFNDEMRKDWSDRAALVCNGMVAKQHVYLEHIQSLSATTNVAFVAGTPITYSDNDNVAVIEGVVQCESSTLTPIEVRRILVKELFIIE